MTITTVKLGNQPFASPYYAIGAEECNNLYVENSISETSKVPYYYVSIPGLRLYVSKTTSKVCRGLYRSSNNRFFGVFGNSFQEILITGERIERGTLTTYSNTCNFADNTHQLILVDGEYGYIFDFAASTFSKIDPETFQNGATHVTCIDTYFLVNRPNSNQYNWSAPNDGLTWDPLDFATKEGMPDDIVALKDVNNMLWVFGNYSIEIHYDNGDTTTQVWQRYESAIIDIGCSAPYSICRLENNVFWVGTDKTGNIAVWSNDGISPEKISTRGIEQLIHSYVGDEQIKNCLGYAYSQAGHLFYCLTFQNSDLTIVYDVATKCWHRRTTIDKDDNVTKWRAQYSAFIFGKNMFGDNNSDAIYYADLSYYSNDVPEGGISVIKRERTTPILQVNQKRVRHKSFQVILQQGVGLENNNELGFGMNPQVQLWISNDSGKTWTSRRYAYIGQEGEYAFRSRFLNLGHSRNRCYKIVISDPVQVILIGGVADMEELSF